MPSNSDCSMPDIAITKKLLAHTDHIKGTNLHTDSLVSSRYLLATQAASPASNSNTILHLCVVDYKKCSLLSFTAADDRHAG